MGPATAAIPAALSTTQVGNQGRSKEMKKFMQEFVRDEKGATAIEYGLLAALIAAVIIVSVESLGNTIDAVFVDIDNKIAPVAPVVP